MVSGRNGNTITDYHYTVAPSGHRLTASETIVAATNNLREVNRAYGYDNLYRLTGENLTAAGVTNLPPNASVAYTHDNVGNRLTRTSNLPGIENQSFGYNANDWILTDTYDNNGNTIQGRVIQSLPPVADQYDYEDRLISRNNGQVTIVYDGDGNRVRKTVNGVTTLYLVDDRNPTGYAQVLEELTSTGGTPAVTRLYVYGADLIAQQQLNGNNQWEATFYGYDAHGNTRYLTDLTGNVTDTYDYDAFGDLIAQTGTTPNLYLYCGEQFDDDLGFYYLRARYLNVDSRRFWTRDTWEGLYNNPATLNYFSYALGNPIRYVDPSGFISIGEMGQVLARIGQLSAQLGTRILPRYTGVGTSKSMVARLIGAIILAGEVWWSSQKNPGLTGIELVDGTTLGGRLWNTPTSVDSFTKMVSELEASSIKRVVITGHADNEGIAIGYDYSYAIDIGKLLEGKLAAGATIKLNGCHSASAALELSKRLPGVRVKGFGKYGLGLNFLGGNIGCSFDVREYMNGSEVP